MTTPAPAPTKVCIRCGQDCSARPRTKDPQGRYTCRECFDAAQNEQAIVLPPPPAKGGRAEHRIEPARPAAASAEDDPGNDIYALMLDDAVQAQAEVTSAPCPGCGRSLKSDAALCVHCGYNARTGRSVTTRQAAEDAERLISDKGRARLRERELSDRAAKLEYIRPLIVALVGLGITCTLLSNRGLGAEGVSAYLFVYSVTVPLSVGAYLVCCLVWLGFDASVLLTTLRLAAIYAVMDILLVGVGLRGVGLGVRGMSMGMGMGGVGFRFGLPILLYALFLCTMMDLDKEDALMVAVVTGIVKVLGTFFLMIWIGNALGG